MIHIKYSDIPAIPTSHNKNLMKRVLATFSDLPSGSNFQFASQILIQNSNLSISTPANSIQIIIFKGCQCCVAYGERIINVMEHDMIKLDPKTTIMIKVGADSGSIYILTYDLN